MGTVRALGKRLEQKWLFWFESVGRSQPGPQKKLVDVKK